MYALNLDKNGRILSVTYEQYDPDGILVENLPDGSISDYKYTGGKYIYDPLPEPPKPEPRPTEEQRISELEAQMKALTEGYAEGVNKA